MLRTAITFVLTFGLSSPASGITFISGAMPETLYVADTPHVVLSDLYLQNRDSVIEPGVELYFTEHTELALRSNCSLTAIGLPGAPIKIAGWEGATWDAIRKDGSYSGVQVEMAWCQISDATRALQISQREYEVTLRDCTLTSNERGVYLYGTHSQYPSVATLERISVAGGVDGFELVTGPLDQMVIVDCAAEHCASSGFSLSGPGVQASSLSATHCGTGLHANSTQEVTGCYLAFNGSGADLVGGTVDSPTAVSSTTVIQNTVYGVTTNGWVRVNNSVIKNNGNFDVGTNSNVATITTVDFRYNQWSQGATQQMINHGLFYDIGVIRDWWDDSGKSLVDYEGFVSPVSVEAMSWASLKSLHRGRGGAGQ